MRMVVYFQRFCSPWVTETRIRTYLCPCWCLCARWCSYYSLFKDAAWTCGNVFRPFGDQTLKLDRVNVRQVGLDPVKVESLQDLQVNKQKSSKSMFYIAHVSSPLDHSKRLYFTPLQTYSFRHKLDFSAKHTIHAVITREDNSLIFPPLSIAR